MLGFLANTVPTYQTITSHCHAVNSKCQIHPHRLRIRRRSNAPIPQRPLVIGQTGIGGIMLNALHRFRHQIGEGGQGNELAGGEEVSPLGHTVLLYAEAESPFG